MLSPRLARLVPLGDDDQRASGIPHVEMLGVARTAHLVVPAVRALGVMEDGRAPTFGALFFVCHLCHLVPHVDDAAEGAVHVMHVALCCLAQNLKCVRVDKKAYVRIDRMVR